MTQAHAPNGLTKKTISKQSIRKTKPQEIKLKVTKRTATPPTTRISPTRKPSTLGKTSGKKAQQPTTKKRAPQTSADSPTTRHKELYKTQRSFGKRVQTRQQLSSQQTAQSPRVTRSSTGSLRAQLSPHNQAILAIKTDNSEALKTLLLQGLNPNSVGENGLSLLQEANQANTLDVTAVLINMDAPPPLYVKENTSGNLINKRKEGLKQSKLEFLNQVLNNPTEGSLERTTGFTSTKETAIWRKDSSFFLKEMSQGLINDTKNIHPKRNESLHLGLANSSHYNHLIQLALNNPPESSTSEKETAKVLNNFSRVTPPDAPLVLAHFGSEQHHIALTLVNDHKGNTTVYVCNRGERTQGTPTVAIKTTKTELIPKLLVELNTIKQQPGRQSLAQVNKVYAKVESYPNTSPTTPTLSSEDFEFKQQASTNCGRASLSAALRVACSIHDIKTTQSYQSLPESERSLDDIPSGPFKSYKELNNRLLTESGIAIEEAKPFKETTKQLAHLLEIIKEDPINNSLQLLGEVEQVIATLPEQKQVQALHKLYKIGATVKTAGKAELSTLKEEQESPKKEIKEIDRQIKQLDREYDRVKKEWHHRIELYKREHEEGVSELQNKQSLALNELNSQIRELKEARAVLAHGIQQLDKQIKEINHKVKHLTDYFNQVQQRLNHLQGF